MPAFLDSLLADAPAWVRDLLGTPLQVLFVVVAALAGRFALHRLIDRVSEGIASGRAGLGRLEERLPGPTGTGGLATGGPNGGTALVARREQRARTLGSVLKNATTVAVTVIAVLTMLPLLGVSVAPLLASAGIIGVALGLGAQSVVKDVLSGLFMIAEDQYGVGDVVDLGDAVGTVESVGLRVTRLRDDSGTIWYLRNGEVLRVGNRSQGWARAVLDVGISGDESLDRAQDLLVDVVHDLAAEPRWAQDLVGEPEFMGVESVTAEHIALRLMVRTRPGRQAPLARELRRQILARFDAEHLPRPTISAPPPPPSP